MRKPDRTRFVLDYDNGLRQFENIMEEQAHTKGTWEPSIVEWTEDSDNRKYTGREFLIVGVVPEELKKDLDELVKKLKMYCKYHEKYLGLPGNWYD